MTKSHLLGAMCVLSLILPASSEASVILNIDDPLVNQHTIVLDPVTFTVTADGFVGGIIFEDFFLTPNTHSGRHMSTAMTAQIDGEDIFSIDGVTTNGTYLGTVTILDPDDLWYNINTSDHFAVTLGQTVTIGGTTSFLNPHLSEINTEFDQTATLWDEGSIALSSSTSLVPTPSAIWLLGSGILGLVGMASRKKT